ncbi:MAG: YjbQ family protein [Anaerolineales bacterium]|nr:YjbQ family protein [Anaerolineales bacterium]
MIHNSGIELRTRGNADMHDLTDQVRNVLRDLEIQNGLVTLFSPSATSAITTIEFESGALADLSRALDQIAPPDADYQHNLRWSDGNGHSHLRAALLKPSLSIPVVEGQLTLGTWQQIIFIDFDVRPRSRRIILQVITDEV